MSRGPGSPVAAPPADLAGRRLPLARWPKGSTLVRIHRAAFDPMHFSPAPNQPPLGRFDSPTGRFRVLYAAQTFEAAFAETILRNPAYAFVDGHEVALRATTVLGLNADIDFVDLTGPGLSQLGVDARLVCGPYALCGAWADALHAHPSQPEGILYPSRFDPSLVCAALFERAKPAVDTVTAPVPLDQMLHDVAAVLDRYGKALEPGDLR